MNTGFLKLLAQSWVSGSDGEPSALGRPPGSEDNPPAPDKWVDRGVCATDGVLRPEPDNSPVSPVVFAIFQRAGMEVTLPDS